jgi:tetratricopeptide (TPR) repeat protein
LDPCPETSGHLNDVVWWVNAERAAVVGGQFTALGQELGLPALTGDDAVAAVGRELRGRDRWLLIFDNAEDPAQIRSLLPGGAGDVLITTRRGGFRSLGTVLDLDVHPGVAADLNDVGQALSDLSRPAEALPLQERALRIDEAAYGPDHPDVATDLNYVGRALSALDRSAEALPLHQRALRIHEAAHGPDHPGVATNLNHVGRALSALGRPAEALPLHQRALRIREAAYGPDHKATRESRQLVEQLKSSPRG